MVDFRKMMLERMSEADRASFLFWEEAYQREKAKHEAHSDSDFIMFFLYYWMNSDFHRKYTDRNHGTADCTYDGAMLKILIPELLMRFMEKNGDTNVRQRAKKEPFHDLHELVSVNLRKWMQDHN